MSTKTNFSEEFKQDVKASVNKDGYVEDVVYYLLTNSAKEDDADTKKETVSIVESIANSAKEDDADTKKETVSIVESIANRAQATAGIDLINSKARPISGYTAKGTDTKLSSLHCILGNDQVKGGKTYSDYIVESDKTDIELPVKKSLDDSVSLYNRYDGGDDVYESVKTRLKSVGITVVDSYDKSGVETKTIEKHIFAKKKNKTETIINVEQNKLCGYEKAVRVAYDYFKHTAGEIQYTSDESSQSFYSEKGKHVVALFETMLFIKTLSFKNRQMAFDIEKYLQLQFVNSFMALDEKEQKNVVSSAKELYDQTSYAMGITFDTYNDVIKHYGDVSKTKLAIVSGIPRLTYKREYYRKLCGTTAFLKSIDEEIEKTKTEAQKSIGAAVGMAKIIQKNNCYSENKAVVVLLGRIHDAIESVLVEPGLAKKDHETLSIVSDLRGLLGTFKQLADTKKMDKALLKSKIEQYGQDDLVYKLCDSFVFNVYDASIDAQKVSRDAGKKPSQFGAFEQNQVKKMIKDAFEIPNTIKEK